jgi:LuxR family transcriptional regulator, maltose regulon positive regulatory protein
MHAPSAKTRVPAAPIGLVTRPRLLDELDRAPEQSLVLVSAPPGYGKTSLLAEWVVRRVPAAAWLTLADDDNDPRRLLLDVAGAVSASSAVSDDSAVCRIPAAAPASVPELASEVVYALDDLAEPVRLVLDNVDALLAHDALDALRVLIRHRPGGLRLVLSSRLDPPLALPRLRLEGRLHEVRVDQLRFTRDEAKALLDMAGARLADAQITTLHALTDGWAAALRLAAITLRNAPDPAASLAAFSGDERSVAEYLVGEILSGFSPEIRDLLCAVSVCDVFPPELAAELSGRQDAAELLNRLERETSMVAMADTGRRLYRMQPLLRSYVRADMQRSMPARVSALHDRAATWWSDRDDPVQALMHISAAGGSPRAVELVHRFAPRLAVTGAHQLLRRTLRQLDEEDVGTDPLLALSSAMCHVEAGELMEAEAAVEQAERAWPEHPTAALSVMHAAARTVHAGQSTGFFAALARHPMPRPPRGEPAVAGLAGLVEAIHQLPGEYDRAAARLALTDVLDLAEHQGFGYLAMQCRTLLAGCATIDGNYDAMAVDGDAVIASAAANGWLGSFWVDFTRGLLANAALLRAEPAEARRYTAQGLSTAGGSRPVRFALRWLHGCAVFDAGQRAAGFEEMLRARIEVGDRPLYRQHAASAALMEYRAAQTLGRPHAGVTLDWLVGRVGECGETALMRAWAEIGQGRPEAGRAILAPLLAGTVATVLPTTRVEALLADAECALATEQRRAAVAAVKEALTVASRLALVRPFVLAGPGVWQLLRAWPDGPDGVRSLIDRAVSARRTLHQPETGLQLSERELTVLSLLPSLLSLEEIAEDLSISVNTLKSHLRAVYLKLGVSSRRAAVVIAHERELLVSSLPLTR